MVNNDRIVPIQKIDLLSMIGTILGLNGTSFSVIAANNVEGDFSAGTGNSLANQPVRSLDFTGSSGTVYFVAAYDYQGVTKSGAAVTMAGATVNSDGVTLYKAVLASNTVTITAVTPSLSA